MSVLRWTTGTDKDRAARLILYRNGKPIAIAVSGYGGTDDERAANMREIANKLNAQEALAVERRALPQSIQEALNSGDGSYKP